MNLKITNIILADDDECDRLVFKDALEEIEVNHHFIAFRNGFSLLEYLNQSELPLSAVLFLDLNMPGMNGLECLREIRRLKANHNLVIAIYSTSASQTDIQDTFHGGANFYLQKPNDFKELKMVLFEVISSLDKHKMLPNDFPEYQVYKRR